MKILARILVLTLSVFFADKLFSGVHIDEFTTAIVIGIVLALLNKFVRPLLIILTIPLTIFTFGIFILVINTLLILLTAKLVDGFTVDGFWTAFFFSIVLSLISGLLESLEKSTRKDDADPMN